MPEISIRNGLLILTMFILVAVRGVVLSTWDHHKQEQAKEKK